MGTATPPFSPTPCFQKDCQRRWSGDRLDNGEKRVTGECSCPRLLGERCCVPLVRQCIWGPSESNPPSWPADGHACQVSALGTELPWMPVPEAGHGSALSRSLGTHQLGSFCQACGQSGSLCEVWEIASQTSGSSHSLPPRRTVAGAWWVHGLSTCPSQGQRPSPTPSRWTLHSGPSPSPIWAPGPLHTVILTAFWSVQALRMR